MSEAISTGDYRLQCSEAAFQDLIVQYAELRGWRWHHETDSRRSKAGLPDLILVRRGRVIFAELKTERGKLRPAQRDWIADLEAVEGVETYVWRPSMWHEIERILD